MDFLTAIRLVVEEGARVTRCDLPDDIYVEREPNGNAIGWNNGHLLDFRADNASAKWRRVEKGIHIALYLGGGCLNSIVCNKDITVHIVDADNLREEGMSTEEIQSLWGRTAEGKQEGVVDEHWKKGN